MDDDERVMAHQRTPDDVAEPISEDTVMRRPDGTIEDADLAGPAVVPAADVPVADAAPAAATPPVAPAPVDPAPVAPPPVAPPPVAPQYEPTVSQTVTTVETEAEPGLPTGVLVRRIVALLFGILQALLILRVVFLLLIANPDNDLVQLVLTVTNPFVEPFRGMFALDSVEGESGSVLDVAALVALLGWTLIEALVFAILNLGSRRADSAA